MKLTVTHPLTLRLPAYDRVHLTLVGCGGTGSHIASGLVAIGQALADKGRAWSCLFIDPDRVESKNVGRQLFGPADVGQPKAEVLANRLNAAFGATIGASVRRIDDSDTFLSERERYGSLSIVIGAVDNNAARAVITKRVKAANGQLWYLDCGNMNNSGQVLLGNITDRKKLKPALGFIDCLPAPSLQYPDLVTTLKPRKSKRAKAPSCAELTAAGEQGLMVNRMAASWALSMLYDLLLGELRYFGVAFDCGLGGVRAWALDEETIKGIK